MKLSTYKIRSMAGIETEVEALSEIQAITIWNASKAKGELFERVFMINPSKDVKRYHQLKAIEEFGTLTTEEKKELKQFIVDFKATQIYSQFKKYPSFKNV